MFETTAPIPFGFLVGVQFPGVDDASFEDSLRELKRLGETLGAKISGSVTQKRDHLDHGTGIGPGKIEELKEMLDKATSQEPARPVMIFFDHELTPNQVRNVAQATKAEVLDRTSLILEIFQRHARSRAAKLQVEIVRLMYSAPRLREKAKGGSERMAGKGAGESEVELDRRKIRDRISELKQELSQLEDERRVQRERRKSVPRVALVGYTNAGKSTLMRALTQSDVYIADKLFATLDTTVRTLQPESKPKILVSDTVGFIKKLPHDLVASFKSTLDEVLEASLVAHIVDASDSAYLSQMETTNSVLQEIGADEVPRQLVLNKVDKLSEEALSELKTRHPEALFLSAKRPEDVGRLRSWFVGFFRKERVEEEILLPYDKQQLRGELFSRCEVLGEEYEEAGVRFKVSADPEDLRWIQSRLA